MKHVSQARRISAHAGWELKLLIRNGEQLLLTFVIPVVLLLALGLTNLSNQTINAAVPTVFAVSILATCFTSLAIGTGFERRSGALRYLGTTPLSRLDLILGKLIATATLTLMSIAVVAITGLFRNWRPSIFGLFIALLIIVLSAAVWVAWALVIAGHFRAEAVLAIANGLFLVMMIFGGVVIATSHMPTAVAHVVNLLPSAAMANGLRDALESGEIPYLALVILAVWAFAGTWLARKVFRWEP
ncbi:MAG: ABC transporter permease [Candidatus Nanopelagicales bacterium]|nr:ABC transporter permease [Candidatus Nanopelagicales bacterium]